MKRIFIASIATLALVLVSAGVAGAASNYVFSNDLTVGSTGADVSALQQWLIDSGYDIPAITSGAAQKGFFGQQTKAAVSKYQQAVGLPSFGFFGHLTREKVNGGAVAMSPANCPAGYSCVPTNPAPVVNCPVGYVCTPIAGSATPTGTLTPGTDGSLTISLSSFAGNNTIKKGETKDMVAVKLQATAGPVQVSRFDVRFNNRPWLYFGSLTLKDSDGNVIATKNLSSSADATEITVGSDYLVRFDALNYVVSPGSDKVLVVAGTVLAATDKLSSDASIIVSVPNDSIRTINGKGFTDSIGLGTVAQSGTTGRTITLSASGSTANILGKLNSSSPDNKIETVSTSGETNGVVLGLFDFKSENQSSTINTFTFTLKDNGSNRAFSTMFKRVYLTCDTKDGARTTQVDSVATSSVFSNLLCDLPKDEWKTIKLSVDVAQSDTANTYIVPGAMASSTITVNTSNIVGVDSNFNTVTASGGNAVTTNDTTFLVAGASVTAPAVTVTDVDNGTSAVVTKTVSFKFTFNNTGTTDLYLTRDPYRTVATSSTIATSSQTITATTTTFSNIDGGTAQNGDSTTVYIVPAGKSRTFTISGLIDRTRDQEATKPSGILKLTKVYFGDDTANIQESNINFGLDSLTTGLVAF